MKIFTNLLVLFLVAFLLLSSAAFAQQKVVTSEGRYVLSLLDSKKDAKSLALINAKGKAIEQAIAYLESLPEVKSAQLTKDQINTLAISITSVDVQSEDWRSSGDIVSVVIPIRAIVDTSNLKNKIARIQEDDYTESIKETQTKLADLQKELERLKALQQNQDIAGKKEAPAKEQKPVAEVKSDAKPQAAVEKKDQPVKEIPSATVEVKPAPLPQAAVDKKDQTAKEMQPATVEVKPPPVPQAVVDKIDQPVKEKNTVAVAVTEAMAPEQKQEPSEVKKTISNDEKQKYENVLKNVFALDCLEKGNIALGDQRWNDAHYVFGKAIELNPDLAEAYTGKSYALQNLKQPQEALKHIDTALKLNPQSARTHGIKAVILKDVPGKIKQALVAVNDAIKLKPENPRFYKIRAEVYAKMGKKVLAQKDFSVACNLGAKESCEKTKALQQKPVAPKAKL